MFLKHKKLIIFVCLSLFVLILFTSLIRNKFDGDELIYQTLSIKLQHQENYNLQNTQILKSIPKEIYDKKIFFYPPTFIVLLSLFHFLLGSLGFKILPPIIFLTTSFFIYKSVYVITKSKDKALKGLLLTFVSPLFLFTSVRDSMDLIMTLLSLISFYFILCLRTTPSKKNIFLAGLFLALSILNKYITVILLIFYLPLLIEFLFRNKQLKNIYIFFIPFIFIIFWFLYLLRFDISFNFFLHFDGSNILRKYNFLNIAFHRPVYFYFSNIFLINPSYLFLLFLFKKDIYKGLIKQYGFLINFLIQIILFLIISFSIIGVWGGTFQMRYLLPVEPFLIILLSIINFENNKLAKILFCIFLIQNLCLFIFNVILLNFPENFSLVELFLLTKYGRP